jgi:hypothetical protein
MRAELKRLLAPAGVGVIWKDFEDRKTGEDFDLVAVGSIEGSCVPPGKATSGAADSHSRRSLADAFVSADRVLPFFEVDCPHLMRVLGDAGGPSMLGKALAHVIAHELYHILAGTKVHQNAGIAKAAFSIDDLISSELAFDPWSLARIVRVSTERAGRLKHTRLDSSSLRSRASFDTIQGVG